MQHLIRKMSIQSSDAYRRMIDKTQVFPHNWGDSKIVSNRFTHSYDVANSAEIMAIAMSNDKMNLDYQKSIVNVCLLHDIGHPPFGHIGKDLLNNKFKELGLEEGFSDNNNNLYVIDKEKLNVTDYEKCSVIKYPQKLYKSQNTYKKKLKQAIAEDVAYFKNFIKIDKFPERTIACEIMDEADRNSYICSDLQDCYSLRMDSSESLKQILQNVKFANEKVVKHLKALIKSVDEKDDILIASDLDNIRLLFNTNYILGDNLRLLSKDEDILLLKQELKKIVEIRYIFVKKTKEETLKKGIVLKKFIDFILDKEFVFSERYKDDIKNSNLTELEKLTYFRDMIAEATNSFVELFCNKNDLLDKKECVNNNFEDGDIIFDAWNTQFEKFTSEEINVKNIDSVKIKSSL